MAERPHILILMADQFRADCLGVAGHPQVQTPSLDRLAQGGVRFAHAVTVNPLCMPARASFINGLYSHNHGMWDNRSQMPADDETFFHHLQAAGYYTGHIGKSHYHPHGRGHLREAEDYMHARGLDYVHETTGPWATVTTDSYLTDHWDKLGLTEVFRADYRERQAHKEVVRPSPLPVEEYPDSYVGRQAVEFIAGYRREQPMALFVGFGGPHEPWDAPGEYATRYPPGETPPPIVPEPPGDWLPEHARARMAAGALPLTPEQVARIRGNYYGKISLVDHWIGRILDTLAERGWQEDTLVVFWSDHGEMAGDHAHLFKSVLYESAVRVPLILRWPGRAVAGQTSAALAEIIDVFPTLLEALELPPSRRCLGRSLLPLLQDPAAPHREASFSEAVTYGKEHITMVRTPTHKYVVDEHSRGCHLYDLQADPGERRNLVGHPGYREIEGELRERVLAFLLSAQVRR